MGASLATWNNVVQRKFFSGSTILTFKIVSFEDVLPCKIHSLIRSVHIAVKSDYGRHRKSARNRVKFVTVSRPHHLTFLKINQYECTLHRTNHERAKILVQYQHAIIHGMKDKVKS